MRLNTRLGLRTRDRQQRLGCHRAGFCRPNLFSSIALGREEEDSPVSDLKKLKRSVNVDICHTQSLNGLQPIEIEEDAEGALYQVDPQTYILAYDSELNGRKITTTVKVGNDTLSLVKIGDVHSRQTFSMDQWLTSQFFYGGGSVVCRNYTKKLDYALTPTGGLIEILYELWSGDTHLGYFNLEFFIR